MQENKFIIKKPQPMLDMNSNIITNLFGISSELLNLKIDSSNLVIDSQNIIDISLI